MSTDKHGDEETLFSTALDIDDEEELERSAAVIGDKTIGLLRNANRIILQKGKSLQIDPPAGEAPGQQYIDVPLRCTIAPHPECRFTWSRLMIDLSPTARAIIHDMAPQAIRGEQPVELETKIGLELKFFSVAVTPERTSKRTVYYPEIVSAGVGTDLGYWDFLALGDEYLHADRELRLLVRAPAGQPIYAKFTLRAKVRMRGWLSDLALVSTSGEIKEAYRLDTPT